MPWKRLFHIARVTSVFDFLSLQVQRSVKDGSTVRELLEELEVSDPLKRAHSPRRAVIETSEVVFWFCFQAAAPCERDGLWIRECVYDEIHNLEGKPINKGTTWANAGVQDGDVVVIGQSGRSQESSWRLDRDAAQEKFR